MSAILNTKMFFSTHVNRIDAKGRVSFPASFRAALNARASQGVMIYRSPADRAIEGITVERMQAMGEALESLSQYAPERAFFETAIFGTAQVLQIDPEGRCSLPRALLEPVGITTEVAFLGRGSIFQIWDPAALEARSVQAAEALKTGAIAFPTLPAGVF
jgi:MraZ protein